MKREVVRHRKIPAFSISIGELEALWNRLTPLFEDPDIRSSIEITLKGETLKFSDIKELKEYSDLKGKIKEFSIYLSTRTLSEADRRIAIRAYNILDPHAEITASAETEAWCAGAIETTYSFLQSYKVWYHWFVAAPIGWILFAILNLPMISLLFVSKDFKFDKNLSVAWLFTIATLAILYGFRRRIFPASVIRVTEDEGFIRKHSAELGLLIAIFSAFIALFSLFLK